jgi:hypothetical protein
MHGSHRTPVLQRLVHRSASTTGTLAHTAGPQEHGFALSIGLPAAHPPYNDNPGRRHDPLFLAEALREGVIFISRGYFQVPAQRLAVFSGFEVKVTELAPWRVSTQATYATIDLRVRALDPGGGARSGLTCQATVSIDDVPCARAAGDCPIRRCQSPEPAATLRGRSFRRAQRTGRRAGRGVAAGARGARGGRRDPARPGRPGHALARHARR